MSGIENFSQSIIVLRLAERMTISLIVAFFVIVFIVVYFKKIQQINFDLMHEKSKMSSNISLASPIFILLIFILYSYIVMSNPVSFSSSELESMKLEKVENDGKNSGADKENADQDKASKSTEEKTEFVFAGVAADKNFAQQRLYVIRDILYASSELKKFSNAYTGENRQNLQNISNGLSTQSSVLDQERFNLMEFLGFDQAAIGSCMPSVWRPKSVVEGEECVEFNAIYLGN